MSAIGKNCVNLRELELPKTASKPTVNLGSGVSDLARGCARLRTLSLPAYRGPAQALNSIAQSLTGLQILRLSAAASLTDAVVENISFNCTRVTELDLSFNDITGERNLCRKALLMSVCVTCFVLTIVSSAWTWQMLPSVQLGSPCPLLPTWTSSTAARSLGLALRLLLLDATCLRYVFILPIQVPAGPGVGAASDSSVFPSRLFISEWLASMTKACMLWASTAPICSSSTLTMVQQKLG